MLAALALTGLALRAGLRLRAARLGRARKGSPRGALLRAHLRLARPAVVIALLGFVGGPASAAWLRGWTPFGSFHAWLGVLVALLFATAGFLGHRLATGRVTGDRGAFATRHGLTGTLALLAGAVAAAAGMVLLP